MSGIYLNVINAQMIADDTLASIIAVLGVGVFQINLFLAFPVKRPIVLYLLVSALRAQAGSSNSEKTEELQNAEKCGAFHTAKSEKAPHTPTINSKTHTKTTPTKEQTRQCFAAPSLLLFIHNGAIY